MTAGRRDQLASRAVGALTCDNEGGPGGVGSTSRGLTHLSDLGGRGVGVSLPSNEIPSTFPVDTFWSKVQKSDGCWLWTGYLAKGYGTFSHRRRTYRAHRVAWLLTKGPHPVDLVLDHLCRVRNCVNPDHLEPVTSRVNTMRGEGPGAENAAKDRCPKDHPYSGDNLRVLTRKDGRPYRQCRECARERARRLWAVRQNCDLCGAEVVRYNLADHKRRMHAAALSVSTVRPDVTQDAP